MSEIDSRFWPADVRAALRGAWSELLGVDTAPSVRNFYTQGGTSLTATRTGQDPRKRVTGKEYAQRS
jgi:hypothetical protein